MFRRIALSTVLGAGLMLAPMSSAFAHDHWHRGGSGAGVVAAVLGTAAIIGAATALAGPPVVAAPAPMVVAPAPVYVAPPAVVYPAPVYAYSPYYGYYRVR